MDIKAVRLGHWRRYYAPGRNKPEGELEVMVKDDLVAVMDLSSFFMAMPQKTAWFADSPVARPGEGSGRYDVPVQIDFRKGGGYMSVIVPRGEAEEALGLSGLLYAPCPCNVQELGQDQ